MAQRTEKEETEFKVVPENITLCVNCGVAGNHASSTNNLCQKCFSATAEVAAGGSPTKTRAIGERSFRSTSAARANLPPTSAAPAEPARREVSRCSGCRRKVGLTGFRCRCGDLFCADHRYSDRHDCSFDYKSAGREAIARENPVVKAAKIVRI